MLGLQARFTLAFLLLVGAVGGLTSGLLYRHIHDRFRTDFDDRVHAAQQAVGLRLERDAAGLRARVEAAALDPRIDALLQDLDHGRLDDDPSVRKRLVADAESLRRSAHLAVLWIIDDLGRRKVLAAAHRTADDALTPDLERYLARGGRGYAVISEPVLRANRQIVVPVLEVAVQRGRLRIVGGRVVGQAVAEDLRLSSLAELEITIRAPDGRVVAGTLTAPDPPDQPAGYETERVIHRNAGEDDPALIVSVHLSRAGLDRRIDGLVRATAFVGGSAALLALMLGWWIARRITRPIHALVDATTQVAAGDRSLDDLPAPGRDEVGRLVAAFRDMAEELDTSEENLRRSERVAAWQEIARELAHEIKNPLTPIRMAMETLRRTRARNDPRFDEIFAESTETILEEVERLKTIVSEFSQFARLPRPNPVPCSLNDLVHQAVVLYRDEDTDLLVTDSLAPDLSEQLLDADRMTQVIHNLLKNAIQATRAVEEPGRVRIATRLMDDGRVELTVEDNGCGIAADDLPRVFTPYFTGKAGGTGLGLAVVHRIVTGHDGRIGVSSEPGEGTRFVIQLPGEIGD